MTAICGSKANSSSKVTRAVQGHDGGGGGQAQREGRDVWHIWCVCASHCNVSKWKKHSSLWHVWHVDMYDIHEMWLISLTHIALESDLSTSSPANAGRRQDHCCGPAGETKCTAVLGLEQLGELGLPWSTPVLSRLEDSKSLTIAIYCAWKSEGWNHRWCRRSGTLRWRVGFRATTGVVRDWKQIWLNPFLKIRKAKHWADDSPRLFRVFNESHCTVWICC